MPPFEQPARAALGDQVGQPVVRVSLGIDGQRLLDHGFELGGVLRRNTGIFGVRDERAGMTAFGDFQSAVEMQAHPSLHFLLFYAAACTFDGDQELRHGAAAPGLVQFRGPADQGLHQRQTRDH